MIFELEDKELSNFREWDEEHKKVCEIYTQGIRGAIGGRLTFSFTPTSLGTAIKVKCACGVECNVTEYDW